MSNLNKQIIASTTNALYKKAKKTGYLNLKKINVLYLYDYYMSFVKNVVEYNDEYVILRQAIYQLKAELEGICDYKSILPNLIVVPNITPDNTAPQMLQPISVNLGNNNNTYILDISEFTEDNYFDQNNDLLKGIYLYISQVNTGTFTYKEMPLTNDIYVNPSDLSKIIYTPDDSIYTVVLPYRIDDVNINSLYSNIYNFTINVTRTFITNEKATIGDVTIYVDNREITPITLTMLTNEYNDPEGDILDAIRIDEISSANLGTFYYNNLPLVINLVISKDDIVNGLIEHRSINQDGLSSDVFNFSVRDSGSLTWVE